MSESEIVEPTHILIGNYRLEKTIGQGTYGKVKLGFSTQDGTKVNSHFFNLLFMLVYNK